MKSLLGQAIRRTYREVIANRSRQVPFWILVGFLPTFIIERIMVANFPSLFVDVRGVHVHHFTWGVIILALVGFIALVWPDRVRHILATVYGIGLALAFDEFGMWLHLTQNYNLDQSEDVMVGILVFLVVCVYATGVLKRLLVHTRRG
jgi:hypothetical protein